MRIYQWQGGVHIQPESDAERGSSGCDRSRPQKQPRRRVVSATISAQWIPTRFSSSSCSLSSLVAEDSISGADKTPAQSPSSAIPSTHCGRTP